MNRTNRRVATRVAPAVALVLVAGLAAPAWAQQVNLFATDGSAEDFSAYAVGSALPTTGDWAVATNVTVASGAAGTYAYFSSAPGTAARRVATTAQIAAGASHSLVLKFWLRYTTNDGTQDETLTDGALAFDEAPTSATRDAIFVDYYDGMDWNRVVTFSGAGANPAFRTGQDVAFKLPSGAFTDQLQIRFAQSYGGASSFASQWAIDDVRIVNPEPGTWALFGLASLGLGGFVARRRQQRRAAQAKTPA